MKNRTNYPILAFLLTLGVVAAVAMTAARAPQPKVAIKEARGKGNMPPALGRHMKEMMKAIPGNGGESREGPGAAAEEHFLALAYPDTDIPLARLTEFRQSAKRVTVKGFPKGKRKPGTWVSVGPTEALYPFTELRSSSSYVPNAYFAGGRATALALDPSCREHRSGDTDRCGDDNDSDHGHCRLWMFAAGGGVWRTKNALDKEPKWRFVSSSFAMNSGSSLALDPNDPKGNTIYAGTGEANGSGDSAAGVGLYKSTNGGNTWTGPLGASVFAGRAIGSIAIRPGSPNTIYVATTRAVLGVSSVSGGAASLIPGAAKWGLYKSTDSGNTWTLVHNGASTVAGCTGDVNEASNLTPCSPRGVRRVVLDPSNADIVYASSYARGVWRSTDAGTTWEQINPSLNLANTTMRPEIAVNSLPGGKTRMYVYEGASGNPTSRLFRTDDAAGALPAFTNLSSSDPANQGFGTHNVCGGQCWYDNFVYTPAGYPDIVYVGGSYAYGETAGISNGRGVVLSTDAGVSSTDMTMDGTDPIHPNALHPDQHALVTHPDNPFLFFEVNDGGLMRSSGKFSDVSAWCDTRGLAGPSLSRCKQLLARVPSKLEGMNKGVQTLQFQSLTVSPFNASYLQGGTQDNGTWQSTNKAARWNNTMIGDGGQSGFDAADPAFRFHTFFNATPDINLSNGDMAEWNWIADNIYYSGELQAFYPAIISDPVVSKSMFAGLGHVWRTKTWGMGSATPADYKARCNEWTGVFDDFCGDWEPLGATTYVPLAYPFLPDPATYAATRLTTSGALYGTDRSGGTMAAVERTKADTSTLWAATSTGRVFISKNADADPASAVTFTRLDSLAATDPNRFVSGIYVDPSNPNHAWVSYSGFNATTPSTPGHVFEVNYDPIGGTATWTDLSHDLGEVPITDVVRDDLRGDLYAASDAGVYRLLYGDTDWTLAGPGMPSVEVAGLTIVPGARRLYAATHGLGAWRMILP